VARVYAAVNILLRDDELAEAEHLCQQLIRQAWMPHHPRRWVAGM